MVTHAMNPADEKITAANEAVSSPKNEVSTAEICFGVLMAVSALAGLWGAVSLMITYFTN
jgi:hypothetical protein